MNSSGCRAACSYRQPCTATYQPTISLVLHSAESHRTSASFSGETATFRSCARRAITRLCLPTRFRLRHPPTHLPQHREQTFSIPNLETSACTIPLAAARNAYCALSSYSTKPQNHEFFSRAGLAITVHPRKESLPPLLKTLRCLCYSTFFSLSTRPLRYWLARGPDLVAHPAAELYSLG